MHHIWDRTGGQGPALAILGSTVVHRPSRGCSPHGGGRVREPRISRSHTAGCAASCERDTPSLSALGTGQRGAMLSGCPSPLLPMSSATRAAAGGGRLRPAAAARGPCCCPRSSSGSSNSSSSRARCRASSTRAATGAPGPQEQQDQPQQQPQPQDGGGSGGTTGGAGADPFVAAAHRLESLIAGVGDGEDELFESMLMEETPESKLQVNAVLGVLVLGASATICWLCGKDMAGGASLSLHSLGSAAIGALAALPLAGSKHLSWSRDGHEANPTMAALHRSLADVARPWLAGMSRQQLALHTALDTLPVLFLMLPAAQGAFATSFSWSAGAIGRSTGVELPPELGLALALGLTGLVSAAVRSTELMADPQAVRAVADAVANADRYYRVMATGSGGAGGQEAEAQRSARAFKAVAVSWREQEQEVCSLFVTLQVLEFLFLGALWRATGDMTAPCVAALASAWVENSNLAAMLASGGGGGGGGSGGGVRQRGGSAQRE